MQTNDGEHLADLHDLGTILKFQRIVAANLVQLIRAYVPSCGNPPIRPTGQRQ